MLDENWTATNTYPARLYFHCPNTNCDGHVKLRDRSRHHAVQCEKCGLAFAIGADPELRKGEIRPLIRVLGGAYDGIIGAVIALILGLVLGMFLAIRWIR